MVGSAIGTVTRGAAVASSALRSDRAANDGTRSEASDNGARIVAMMTTVVAAVIAPAIMAAVVTANVPVAASMPNLLNIRCSSFTRNYGHWECLGWHIAGKRCHQ
jgi:hypothetical protein